MEKQIVTQRVATALGIATMSPNDQMDFLARYGDRIVTTALQEFEPLLDEAQRMQLEAYLATDPELEELLDHLTEQYEHFAAILVSVIEEIMTELDQQ